MHRPRRSGSWRPSTTCGGGSVSSGRHTSPVIPAEAKRRAGTQVVQAPSPIPLGPGAPALRASGRDDDIGGAAWIAQAVASVRRGEPLAMVTVVGAQGSTPRELGARMLVWPDRF